MNPLNSAQPNRPARCACGAELKRHARGGRKPVKCAACVRASRQKHWAERRRRQKTVSDGIYASRKAAEFMSFPKIARALDLNDHSSVIATYKRALWKLRAGGGEALRDVLTQQGLSGLVEILRTKAKPSDPGLRLLEYQMKMAELWQTHERLLAAGHGAEAVKVRAAIERFQRAMKGKLDNFLK